MSLSTQTTYLIATANKHKIEEISRILSSYPLCFKDLSKFNPIDEPIEDGDSYLANARIKSRYYSKATGLPALADDSGLEVDALEGRPGMLSARYAGAKTPHAEKILRLLQELNESPHKERSARFRCVACLTFPDGKEYYAQGTMEGIIGSEPKGEGGFGYDPILIIPELNSTVAELTSKQKDSYSHRAKALRRLMEILKIEPYEISKTN